MPTSALPQGLKVFDEATGTWKSKLHTDWPWPFSKIPRGATAFKWGHPRMIAGNQKDAIDDGRTSYEWAPLPIGEAGSWQISYYPDAPWWAKVTGLALYASASGKKGPDGKFRHWRLGTRWDDVDDYSTILSVATRRFTGDDSQDTST